MNIPNLYIGEIFNSIQGEGTLTGVPTLFVRTQGCRVGCKWCDTKYSWKLDKQYSAKAMDVYAVVKDWLKENKNHYICFTGGEPMEQGEALVWFADKLYQNGYRKMSMETSGVSHYDARTKKFVLPDRKHIIDLNISELFFSVSPKLKSALGNRFNFPHLVELINYWRNNIDTPYRLQFKFVIGTEEDLEIMDSLCAAGVISDNGNYHCIQVEDSCIGNKKIISKFVDFVNENNYIRLLVQQHKIIRLK